MPISNPSMPSVPDGVHVDDLTLDTSGLLITAHATMDGATCLNVRTLLDADAQRLLANPQGSAVARPGCGLAPEGAPLPLQPLPRAGLAERVSGLAARRRVAANG